MGRPKKNSEKQLGLDYFDKMNLHVILSDAFHKTILLKATNPSINSILALSEVLYQINERDSNLTIESFMKQEIHKMKQELEFIQSSHQEVLKKHGNCRCDLPRQRVIDLSVYDDIQKDQTNEEDVPMFNIDLTNFVQQQQTDQEREEEIEHNSESAPNDEEVLEEETLQAYTKDIDNVDSGLEMLHPSPTNSDEEQKESEVNNEDVKMDVDSAPANDKLSNLVQDILSESQENSEIKNAVVDQIVNESKEVEEDLIEKSLHEIFKSPEKDEPMNEDKKANGDELDYEFD